VSGSGAELRITEVDPLLTSKRQFSHLPHADESDKNTFVGTRQYILRSENGSLNISRCTIVFDQAILDAKNISVFW